jgi:hypothetical protein
MEIIIYITAWRFRVYAFATDTATQVGVLRAQARGRLKTASHAQRVQRLAWFTLLVSAPWLFLSTQSEHAAWYLVPMFCSFGLAGLAASIQDQSRRGAWRATLQAHLLIRQ